MQPHVLVSGTVDRIVHRGAAHVVASVRPFVMQGRPETSVSLSFQSGEWTVRRGDFVSCAAQHREGEAFAAIGTVSMHLPVELKAVRARCSDLGLQVSPAHHKELQRSLAVIRRKNRTRTQWGEIVAATGRWWEFHGVPLSSARANQDPEVTELEEWFRSLGFECSAPKMQAVRRAFPARAVQRIQDDVLGLLAVPGFGMQTVLRLVGRMRIAPSEQDQLRVLVMLHQQADDLQYTCSRMAYLRSAFGAGADSVLEALVARQRVVVSDEQYVYLAVAHRLECALAALISALFRSDDRDLAAVRPVDVGIHDGAHMHALPRQRSAVRNACHHGHRLSIVTGRAGTGKSLTLRFIRLALLASNPLRRVFAFAPTHRAVRRVREALAGSDPDFDPADAATLHHLLAVLEWGAQTRSHGQGPLQSGFARWMQARTNAVLAPVSPAHAHEEVVLLIDEMSMVDQDLMGRAAELLLRANADGILLLSRLRVVLMGDCNQLASIGPGDVLYQLCLRFAEEPSVLTELDQVVRQQSSSTGTNTEGLRAALEAILAGNLPSDVGFSSHSFTWMAANASEHLEREAREFGSATWFMAATHRSIDRHTPLLRSILNPDRRDVGSELEHDPDPNPEGLQFRMGDRVLFRQNWHEQQIFNGDLGLLEDVGIGNARLLLDGRSAAVTVEYDPDECPFEMAYMTTVHAAQGSEAQRVVIVIDQNVGPFLTRNLLYTAVSRAKRHCLLLAPASVIAGAVLRQNPPRLTRLASMIKFK